MIYIQLSELLILRAVQAQLHPPNIGGFQATIAELNQKNGAINRMTQKMPGPFTDNSLRMSDLQVLSFAESHQKNGAVNFTARQVSKNSTDIPPRNMENQSPAKIKSKKKGSQQNT